MRSLARLFSSSRRAPPKAASNLYLSSAWRRPSVFITCVCTEEPDAIGEMPRATPSSFICTMRSMTEPRRGFVAKRDHLAEFPRRVDVQQAETAAWPAQRPSCATCSIALESLPIEYSMTGFAKLGHGLAHNLDRLRLKPAQADMFVSPVHSCLPGPSPRHQLLHFAPRREPQPSQITDCQRKTFPKSYFLRARRTASMIRSCVSGSR